MQKAETMVKLLSQLDGDHPVALLELRTVGTKILVDGACHVPEGITMAELFALAKALGALQGQLLDKVSIALNAEVAVATPPAGNPEVHDQGSPARTPSGT